jgi:hypothetical protein
MTTKLRTFIDIDASPERVWQVLTDLPAYPEWNPFITRAEGTLAVGHRLSLTVPRGNALLGVTLRGTVLEVTPCRRLRWSGRQDRLGIPGLFDAEHILTITPRDQGVRLWQQSWFRGLLVPVMTRFLNRHRLPAHMAMEAALKDRAEGAPATGPG